MKVNHSTDFFDQNERAALRMMGALVPITHPIKRKNLKSKQILKDYFAPTLESIDLLMPVLNEAWDAGWDYLKKN